MIDASMVDNDYNRSTLIDNHGLTMVEYALHHGQFLSDCLSDSLWSTLA